ncbi:MAG: VWA domain-containing protein [Planctomycetota bacterium]
MVEPDLFPVLAAALAAALAAVAEAWHAARIRRLRRLAFGPRGRPAAWVRTVPFLRPAAAAGAAWGLVTLLLIEPRTHSASGSDLSREGDYRHVLLVLDVSPSMQLPDAGPSAEQSRLQRARDVLESFFARIPLDQHRITVVAVYNGALPVVEDTRDVEVVRNILGDLPLHFAFPSGRTRLFDGLEAAVRIARPWNPRSTLLMVVSDGDTVPAQGMPKLPASIDDVLIVGIGDPLRGSFIDGRQSRQDVSTLRQIAARLGGVFHNGNTEQLGSTLIGDLTRREDVGALERLTRREYALLACGAGSASLALLPLLLHFLGTSWRPGRPGRRPGREASPPAGEGLRIGTSGETPVTPRPGTDREPR